MKKILRFMIITAMLFLALKFCPDIIKYRDRDHAILSVTFDQQTQFFETVNASDFHWKKSPRKYLFEHPVIIQTANKKIHVKFSCPQCGKFEEFDMEAPTTKMFHCNCRHQWYTKDPHEEVLYLVVQEETD